MSKKMIPRGISDFEELRKEGYYYIDKSNIIKEFFAVTGKVSLFTRPRRFGKTLLMSMLKSFFDITTDKSVFHSLAITSQKDLCEKHMGKYPIIFISFKDVSGMNFEDAMEKLKDTLQSEVDRHPYLLNSKALHAADKRNYEALQNLLPKETSLYRTLKILTELLHKHYAKKVILLIDEYDVPLNNAFNNKYYDPMVSVIRSLFSAALKDNSDLEYSFITGCLRISKESIFTGVNNFVTYPLTDPQFSQYFGFTENEVDVLLQYYEIERDSDIIKEWYNGYNFAGTKIYNPWDVLNYCSKVIVFPDSKPEPYWINSNGNEIIRRFISLSNPMTRDEIGKLIDGNAVEKPIKQEITYLEVYESIENLWSVLFTTGYLTYSSIEGYNNYSLRIPNKSIEMIFVDQIQSWFKERVSGKNESIAKLFTGIKCGDKDLVQASINDILLDFISSKDYSQVGAGQKENFYHGLLLGIFANGNWAILSNSESGYGYLDIAAIFENTRAFVIEIKYAGQIEHLSNESKTAMEQIEDRRYARKFQNDDFTDIYLYGISFYKKWSHVTVKHLTRGNDW